MSTMHAGSRPWVLDAIDHWASRGWLRRLDAALARFVSDTTPSADAVTLLVVALTAHLEGRGNTCLVLADLLDDADTLLAWPREGADALRFVLSRLPGEVSAWAATLAASGAVRRVDPDDDDDDDRRAGGTPFVLDRGRFYLRRYWDYERRIASAVTARAATIDDVDEKAVRSWIERLFDGRTDAIGVDWQKVACALALRGRIAIITGGPGTGKTYTAARLVALLFATAHEPATLRIALAAPTGKAAARLRQAIDGSLTTLAAKVGDDLPLQRWTERIGPARTLHALLGTRRRSRRFRHDAAHPLALDVLIVDEASMVHVEMMDALLAALPATASLVLIGDRDQLSSVEAGAVLGELCPGAAGGHRTDDTVRYIERATAQRVDDADRDPQGSSLAQQTCSLRRSVRFGGAIARFAEAVNAGSVAAARAELGTDRSLSAVDAPHATVAVNLAVRGYRAYLDAVAQRPDSLFAEDHEAWVAGVLDAFERFRVLCALREGEWGAAGLNRAIASRLASTARPDEWYAGRPVLVARNDYDLGLFNGDVGIALPVHGSTAASAPRLRVWFRDGDGFRSIGLSRLTEVETAFAMTVHRAQGSEFDEVALVLPPESHRGLTRELLYTAATRARRAFTLITARDASLDEAILQTTRRSSGLAAMIAARDRPDRPSEIQ